MGKSRQGSSYPKIIDRADLRSGFRNVTEGVITSIFWIIWMYFIAPIITLAFWLMGIRFFREALFGDRGLMELLEVIQNAAVVILCIFILNIIWVFYNYRIFKRTGNRRRFAPLSSDKAFAKFFGIDPELLKKTKEANRIEISLRNNRLSVISHK